MAGNVSKEMNIAGKLPFLDNPLLVKFCCFFHNQDVYQKIAWISKWKLSCAHYADEQHTLWTSKDAAGAY